MNATLDCTAQMPYGYLPRLKGLYIATELFIAVVAIVGNFLVCLAVTRNKKLRTITNYFLVSLAVSDILVGLVAIPCAVLTNLGQPYHDLSLCLVLLSILMVLTQSSILSLLAVAAERYMAILLPFQYQRIMSPRNAQLALLLTWSLATVCGCVPLMDWHRQPGGTDYCIFTCMVDMNYMVYFNFFCCLLVPLIAMFIIYGRIFLAVRHQLRRIAMVTGAPEVTSRAVGSGGTSGSGPEDAGSPAAVGGGGADAQTSKPEGESGTGSLIETEATTVFSKSGLRISSAQFSPRGTGKPKCTVGNCQEMRKATSLFLLLFLFTVCWMPIHIINSVLFFCPQCNVPMWITLAAILLSHANSALNPILYAYRMGSFRRTLMGMWTGVWRPATKPQRQQRQSCGSV